MQSTDVVKELVAIKKLLILGLANAGMTQSQIAKALDIDRTSVSRMFAKGTFSGTKSKEGANGE